LIDAGLPLEHPFGSDIEEILPQPLFDDIKSGKKKLNGIIFSHAHLDHFGLIERLPPNIPIYCGEASAELINLQRAFNPRKIHEFRPIFFKARKIFRIGEFVVTPYLMDHSAFDSYGFLLSAGGKNIFYSGDFRAHGRKTRALDLLKSSPLQVDVLLLEGTTVGPRSHELFPTEQELEEAFLNVIQETAGIVLVSAASMNIDRLVTIFKAATRTNRYFVTDFYTAEILKRLGRFAKLPQPSWPRVKICYSRLMRARFRKLGLNEILERQDQNAIRWSWFTHNGSRSVFLIRPNFMEEIDKFINLNGASWIYSLWPGYLESSRSLQELQSYLKEKKVRIEVLHTSGHAKISDLIRLVEIIKPNLVVPMHTFYPDDYSHFLERVRILKDGEVFTL
jgi:ribonuclease J